MEHVSRGMHFAGQEGRFLTGTLPDLELAEEVRPCSGEANCWDFFPAGKIF